LAQGKTDSEFDPIDLQEGLEVEMEHTTEPEIAKEIAKDHLVEDPDYYIKLKQMEEGSVKHGRVIQERVDYLAGVKEAIQSVYDSVRDWIMRESNAHNLIVSGKTIIDGGYYNYEYGDKEREELEQLLKEKIRSLVASKKAYKIDKVEKVDEFVKTYLVYIRLGKNESESVLSYSLQQAGYTPIMEGSIIKVQVQAISPQEAEFIVGRVLGGSGTFTGGIEAKKADVGFSVRGQVEILDDSGNVVDRGLLLGLDTSTGKDLGIVLNGKGKIETYDLGRLKSLAKKVAQVEEGDIHEGCGGHWKYNSSDDEGVRLVCDKCGELRSYKWEELEKESSLEKVSYIVHMPGHKNSAGEDAPWVIKSHDTEKILSSHKSREAAEKHLQQMHIFKGSQETLNPGDEVVVDQPKGKYNGKHMKVLRVDGETVYVDPQGQEGNWKEMHFDRTFLKKADGSTYTQSGEGVPLGTSNRPEGGSINKTVKDESEDTVSVTGAKEVVPNQVYTLKKDAVVYPAEVGEKKQTLKKGTKVRYLGSYGRYFAAIGEVGGDTFYRIRPSVLKEAIAKEVEVNTREDGGIMTCSELKQYESSKVAEQQLQVGSQYKFPSGETMEFEEYIGDDSVLFRDIRGRTVIYDTFEIEEALKSGEIKKVAMKTAEKAIDMVVRPREKFEEEPGEPVEKASIDRSTTEQIYGDDKKDEMKNRKKSQRLLIQAQELLKKANLLEENGCKEESIAALDTEAKRRMVESKEASNLEGKVDEILKGNNISLSAKAYLDLQDRISDMYIEGSLEETVLNEVVKNAEMYFISDEKNTGLFE